MKKFFPVSISLLSVLALIFIAATPVQAAGYIVSSVAVNRNGSVVVYIDIGSLPYLANTSTFALFSKYGTTCNPNGAGLLACHIQGQIAQQHGGKTAYILMNANGDKAFFVVPNYQPKPPENPCRQPMFTRPTLTQPLSVVICE